MLCVGRGWKGCVISDGARVGVVMGGAFSVRAKGVCCCWEWRLEPVLLEWRLEPALLEVEVGGRTCCWMTQEQECGYYKLRGGFVGPLWKCWMNCVIPL